MLKSLDEIELSLKSSTFVTVDVKYPTMYSDVEYIVTGSVGIDGGIIINEYEESSRVCNTQEFNNINDLDIYLIKTYGRSLPHDFKLNEFISNSHKNRVIPTEML